MSEPRASRRRRPPEPPEDSVRLRALVLAAVMVSAGAVVAQGAVDLFTALAAMLLIPVGYVFSHARRRGRNVAVKALLAVGLFVALGSFLLRVNVAVSIDEARIALASLFLWVQILHSFDLPRRRDLAFSMASSVILMAEAGSLSLGTGFLLFLLPYGALAAGWLYASQRLRAESAAGAVAPLSAPRGRLVTLPRARSAARIGVASLVATTMVFLALPRYQGLSVTALPFSIARGVPAGGPGGGIVNPALPSNLGDRPPQFGAGYPGFGVGVDLRSRGRLSDRIVLKVRSPEPALWRGQAYDVFDGVRWSIGDTSLEAIGGEAPLTLPRRDDEVAAYGGELIQTFYVQVEQPNIVFAAYQGTRLFFPAAGVEVDRYGAVISPLLLEPGMVYSVVSRVPQRYPAVLRASSRAEAPAEVLERYTQVPELTPRVRRLAEEITRDADTDYDAALAVQSWLRKNTEYNLDVPPEPPGSDPLDRFLFDVREGFCEHIATSMAVLLRARGIPTRLAVGFGPGNRNAFTGYFEVAESDAHSWVEVYFPGSGWIPFDPTFGVPQTDTSRNSRFIAGEVLRAVGEWMGGLIPEPVRDAARAAGRAVGRAAVVVAGAWPAVLAAGVLLVAWVLQWRRRQRTGPPLSPAAAAFVSMCDTFERRGLARPGSRTPSEHLGVLLRDDPLARRESDALRAIVGAFEAERFSPSPPAEPDVDAAAAAAARLSRAARERSPG